MSHLNEAIKNLVKCFSIGSEYGFSAIEGKMDTANNNTKEKMISERVLERIEDVKADQARYPEDDHEEVSENRIREEVESELEDDILDSLLELDIVNPDGNLGETFIVIRGQDVVASFVYTGYTREGVFNCGYLTDV